MQQKVAILVPKLTIPQVRPQTIARLRLLEQLKRSAEVKLTLLSAPAGYGKTTLLSEWALLCRLPLCWFTIDINDNDQPGFFQHLAAAMEKVKPGCIETVSALFHPPLLAGANDAMAVLINELAGVQGAFILILDDYYLIHDQGIHAAMSQLLAHLPASMHLVIATREDPPFSLARLRAGGQMLEMRMADLCFSPEETTEFFNVSMDLSLAESDLLALHQRTEGWAAGLQLAALSLQGRQDAATFVHSFSGSNRFILDYLAEEVLQRLSLELQDFLLCTAILQSMCAGLCDAVCGSTHSQDTLAELERLNLFLVPLDEQRYWFRYHQLFTDLLRRRLQASRLDIVPELHRRAALWYEQNGFNDEAIGHAISAQDYRYAACLIEKTAQTLLMRGRIHTLYKWLEELPAGIIDSSRELRLIRIWVLLLSASSLELVESLIAGMAGAHHDELLENRLDVLKAYVAILKGDVATVAECARRALAGLPASHIFSRNIAALMATLAHVFSGDLKSGQESLDALAHLSLKSGNLLLAVISLCNMAEIYIRLAQLPKAMRMYEKALEIASYPQGERLVLAGDALIGIGEIKREWNELESAEKYLSEGIELVRSWQEIGMLSGCLSLAKVKQAQGDTQAAQQAVEKAWQLAVQYENTDFDDFGTAMIQAHINLQQNKLAEALEWAQRRRLDEPVDVSELDRSDDFTSFHLRKYEYLVAVRIYLRLRRFEHAAVFLDALLPRMQAQGRIRLLLEVWLLKALLCKAQQQPEEAVECLKNALVLAQSGAFVRIFIDEGEDMAQLLHEAARRGICTDYSRRLLSQFTLAVPSMQPEGALVLPLTRRELEVLQMLDSPATNQDIARRLFISTNTVKKHVASIMSKLEAGNRRQAVSKAASLGLLKER